MNRGKIETGKMITVNPNELKMRRLESLCINVSREEEAAAAAAKLEAERIAQEEEKKAAARERYDLWKENVAAKKRKLAET